MIDGSDQNVYFRNCTIKPEFEYTYDTLGQLIKAKGRAQLPAGNKNSNSVSPYDRHCGARSEQLSGDVSRLYTYLETYEYDTACNMTSMTHKAANDTRISGWTRTYWYREASLINPAVMGNRLSWSEVSGDQETYKYEGIAGRMGFMTAAPGYTALKWNFDGTLASTSTQRVKNGTPETTYYVYDHTGKRKRKVIERAALGDGATRRRRDVLFLDGLEIDIKLQGDGETPKRTRKTSTVQGDEVIALIETTSKASDIPQRPGADSDSSAEECSDKSQPLITSLVRYCISDNIEADDHGDLVSYEEYSPFGANTFSASRSNIRSPRKYRFARYEYDRETGMYYCGTRYYAPWLGRWISPDPLGTIDGFNLYAYCKNDPVNLRDPDGTCPWDPSGKAAPSSEFDIAKSLQAVVAKGIAVSGKQPQLMKLGGMVNTKVVTMTKTGKALAKKKPPLEKSPNTQRRASVESIGNENLVMHDSNLTVLRQLRQAERVGLKQIVDQKNAMTRNMAKEMRTLSTSLNKSSQDKSPPSKPFVDHAAAVSNALSETASKLGKGGPEQDHAIHKGMQKTIQDMCEVRKDAFLDSVERAVHLEVHGGGHYPREMARLNAAGDAKVLAIAQLSQDIERAQGYLDTHNTSSAGAGFPQSGKYQNFYRQYTGVYSGRKSLT